MKKGFKFLIVALMSLGVMMGTAMTGVASKTYVLRYAAQGSNSGVRAKALLWWANEVAQRTGGRLKIQFFWSGSLLKAGDAMEGIGAGTADIGGAWGIYTPAKTPLWTVGDTPFSHDDPYVGLMAMQEMFKTYPPLINELKQYNVKILAPFVSSMTQLGTSKKPVYVPDDTKGMKIRYAGGLWARFWKDCGAVPVKLSQGEVYEGLMRGTVDATQSYFFILDAYKHWDVLKYYTVINAGEICSYGLAINLDTWKELPPDLQKTLQAVSDEFVVRYAKGLEEARKAIIPVAEKKGMKFIYLTPAQKQVWLDKAKPFMKEWVAAMDAKGLPGFATQAKFLLLVDKYRNQVQEHGYPWNRK